MHERKMDREERDRAIVQLKDINQRVVKVIKQSASKNRLLELLILVLSTLTSGSLWIMLSQSFPKPLTWIGAALSTVTTGLTLYFYLENPRAKRDEALFFQKEVLSYLASVRSSPFVSMEDHWQTLKEFQHRLSRLENT